MRTRPRAPVCRNAALSAAMLAAAVATAVGTAMSAPPDNLRPVKSRFTTFDLRDCTVVKRHQDGGAWRCEGVPGYPVYVAEGDLRVFMSFGANPDRRRAATQTLKPFNALSEGPHNRIIIEWRTQARDGKERPYAAIVRYLTSSDTAKGQVLVVTRITETEACHMAYVDALANPEPVTLARSAADELAAGFDCRTQPRVIGVSGKSPM